MPVLNLRVYQSKTETWKRGKEEKKRSRLHDVQFKKKWLFKISKRIYIYDSALKVSIPSTNHKMFGSTQKIMLKRDVKACRPKRGFISSKAKQHPITKDKRKTEIVFRCNFHKRNLLVKKWESYMYRLGVANLKKVKTV